MKNKHIFLIAEAGVNHNGNLVLAKKLADIAKLAGSDAVKYQTFIPEDFVTKSAGLADYQKKTEGKKQSQLSMVQKLALSFQDFREIKEHCDRIGIVFLSTPFDYKSMSFLDELNMPIWKIPSGEITNLPYLMRIAHTNKPVLLSTGMSNLEEIRFAVESLRAGGSSYITLLHCNSAYPTPIDDANLLAINTLRDTFGLPVGYSDHTTGIEAALAAAAMGAVVIEKHFTLNKNMKGPDHKASLDPKELETMVKGIRKIEKAMGSGIKKPSQSEAVNINVVRKSIVAKRKIKFGEVFSEENLAVKRPGDGISPVKWFEVIGKIAIRDFDEDELIEL